MLLINLSNENQLRPRLLQSFLLAVLFISTSSPITAQDNFKIGKIEFEGLNRLSAEEMIATAALKIGEPFDIAALDAAAQRLADSGLFEKVAYRTRANRDQITITFQVEEAKARTSRVLFDNFIWFTDSELIGAVQRDIPSFSGSAPDNGDVVGRIAKALQRFLHEHQIEATVNYMVSQDSPNSPNQEHVFSVTGVPMPICALHFPGASDVSEAKLIESSAALIGDDYSRKFVSSFAASRLFPIYRELGHLKAAFAPPLPKPEASSTCRSGVDLTIPVDEGYVYRWDKAVWSGTNALMASELDAVIRMPSGQPANGLIIDKFASEIQKAYGRRGYLLARIRSIPEFDDSTQKVMYKIDVLEGPQFRMGKLITKGFAENLTKTLTERWSLKTGDVFDQGYVAEFSQKQMGEILRNTFLERRAQGKPVPDIKWASHLNREALTVDVTVEFTN